jgi:hypothetical protein
MPWRNVLIQIKAVVRRRSRVKLLIEGGDHESQTILDEDGGLFSADPTMARNGPVKPATAWLGLAWSLAHVGWWVGVLVVLPALDVLSDDTPLRFLHAPQSVDPSGSAR